MKKMGMSLLSALGIVMFFGTALFATELTTDQLKGYVEDPGYVIVDSRPSYAFNGWAVGGIERGGHIPGALNFCSSWIENDKKDRDLILVEALNDKGIVPDKKIVICDSNGKNSENLAKWLKKRGFKSVYTYDINKWASNQSLPMVKYPEYELLVPPVIVKEIIDGSRPETFEDAKSIKIFEASWGKEKNSYLKGHIPTAVHINTDWVEPPKEYEVKGESKPVTMWVLASDGELLKLLKRLGIKSEDTVILSGWEQMAAYRVGFVLEYMGVKDVRIVDGGTGAWKEAGYDLSVKSVKASPVSSFGLSAPQRPSILDTLEEAKDKLANDSNYLLLDIRTWDEHIGKISGYSYHNRKGRIPGTLFAYAGKSDAYSLDYYRNIDRTMRQPEDVKAMWKKAGVDMSKDLSFMCGSGWRAAEVWFYSRVMGLDNTSMYSDGWIGWSNAGYPVEKGEPVK